jgi:small subunit ribosomal protein S4
LERRFDNVVYRLGFAMSRAHARQLVSHNHFLVNGKKLNIPSFLVNVGDTIEIKENSRKIPQVIEALAAVDRRGIPQWLEIDKDNYRGVIRLLPSREDITMPIQVHLIVELYSK